MTTRRTFIRTGALGLLAATLAVTRPAAADTKVKFVLRLADPGAAGALHRGEDPGALDGSGLDVAIDRGTGSQKTIELVATGTYDLGYGDINSMIEYNVKIPGNPLVGIYMVLNTPPFSLLSLKKYGVKQPKDLKGLAIGAPAGDAPRRLWPIFAKNVGVPVDSVTWTNMAPPLRGSRPSSRATSRPSPASTSPGS